MERQYYYKILKKSPTGILLSALITKCNEAIETARRWVVSQGADSYYEALEGVAGGVTAVEFSDNAEHEGWERIVASDGRVFYTPVKSSKTEHDMMNLPFISANQFVDILKIHPLVDKDGNEVPFVFQTKTPIVFQLENYWYIKLPQISDSLDCQNIDVYIFDNCRKIVMQKMCRNV